VGDISVSLALVGVPGAEAQNSNSNFAIYEKSFYIFVLRFAGWYRECGIIPHTKDLDLAALIDDFSDNFLEKSKMNKRFKLDLILGYVRSNFNLHNNGNNMQDGPTKSANFCMNRYSFTISYRIKLKFGTHTPKT
jgi:hypothetical protein